MFISQAFAQSASEPNSIVAFMPIVIIFLIFYLLIIRPQQKQRKKHQEMIKSIKKGDEVVTSSGMFGKVLVVADSHVILEIAKDVEVKIVKGHIADIPKEKEKQKA